MKIMKISRATACAVSLQSYPLSRVQFKADLKRAARPSFGLFLDSNSPLIAEQMAASRSFDWLLVDGQHSPVGSGSTLQAMLTSIAVHRCPSLVRVGGPEDRIGIQQSLDLGACGIMIPTVRTVADVEAAVQAAFFPPQGSRSIAFPIAPQLGRSVAEFLSSANDEVLLVVQVETKECYDNLEEILAVPGVDAAFVGPFDLSFALGLFDKHGYPAALSSDDLRQATQLVAEKCKAAGVIAGSFAAGLGGAEVLVGQGYTLMSTGTDVGLLGAAAEEESAKVRQLVL